MWGAVLTASGFLEASPLVFTVPAIVVVLAVLIDLGVIGGSSRSRRND